MWCSISDFGRYTTINNTISIIKSGPFEKELSNEYGIDPVIVTRN